MHSSEHFKKSLERLEKNDPTQLYAAVPRIIEKIVEEVHKSLDQYFIPSDNSDNILLHREKLHHEEGIKKITRELTQQYGKAYRRVIEQEARQHVLEDMFFIPKRADYKDKTFWDRWKAQHEMTMSV